MAGEEKYAFYVINITYNYSQNISTQSVFNHALGIKSVTDAYGNPMESPYTLGSVFTEACGVGFHHQCYPSNSIDFGLSFTAMHWLSRFPSSLIGEEYMHAARCPESPKLEQDQAAKDWSGILEARSKELVPGGKFVCANFCVSSEGYFLGKCRDSMNYMALF